MRLVSFSQIDPPHNQPHPPRSAPPQVFEGQPNAALMAGGIVSGVVASVLTQPLDTVKTRMQANLGDVDGPYSTFARGTRTLMCAGRRVLPPLPLLH